MSLLRARPNFILRKKEQTHLLKNTPPRLMSLLFLGEQAKAMEISSTSEALASRKAVSWKFPILQRATRQNITHCVKRNSSLAAFGKTFLRRT